MCPAVVSLRGTGRPSRPESCERCRGRDLALGANVGAAGAARRPAKVILDELAVAAEEPGDERLHGREESPGGAGFAIGGHTESHYGASRRVVAENPNGRRPGGAVRRAARASSSARRAVHLELAHVHEVAAGERPRHDAPEIWKTCGLIMVKRTNRTPAVVPEAGVTVFTLPRSFGVNVPLAAT